MGGLHVSGAHMRRFEYEWFLWHMSGLHMSGSNMSGFHGI